LITTWSQPISMPIAQRRDASKSCGCRPLIGCARACSTSREWRGSPPTGPSASMPKTFGTYPLNFPPIESRNQRRSEACLNAEPLEKSELLGKQPLRSGVQIPQRLGFGSVELAVRHRSDGRLFNQFPGGPSNGVGIEPQIQLSCCHESKIAQVGANARPDRWSREHANRSAGGDFPSECDVEPSRRLPVGLVIGAHHLDLTGVDQKAHTLGASRRALVWAGDLREQL